MLYKVSHFSIMKVSPELTLLSMKGGAHRLQQPQLVEALVALGGHCGQRLRDTEVKKLFSKVPDKSGELLPYLKDKLKVITECSDAPVRKLAFYTDSEFVRKMIESHLKGDGSYTVSFPESAEKFQSDTLIAVYREKYDPELIRALVKQNQSSPILHSYLFERYFFVDSLYIGEEALPCHFCNFLNLEDSAINANNQGTVDYIGLYRRMLTDHRFALSALPVSDLDRCQILSILYPKIHAVLCPDEPFLTEDRYSIFYTTKLDIRRRKLDRDIAHHHPTCDCVSPEAP